MPKVEVEDPRLIENELGHPGSWGGTGSTGWQQIDSGEENIELQWPFSVAVYDRMWRTDGKCASIERAVTLPIKRTPWRLDPAEASDEVTSWCSRVLGLPILGREDEYRRPRRMKGRFSFRNYLRHALLMVRYGHMVFEQQAEYDAEAGLYTIRKLAPRMPQTIVQWNVAKDGGLISIEQEPWRDDAKRIHPIPIPIDRLVVHVNDQEGAAWAGTSIYRAAFKHWKLKDRLYRIQSIIGERGAGVPIAIYPKGTSDADIGKYESMAQGYRVGEKAGGALPEGADLRLKGIEGTIPDLTGFIKQHDEAIAQSMLMMFLQLGQTETGSRALGEEFVDFFLLALQSVIEELEETINQHVVEDLVDWNWGSDEPAPLVKATDIGAEQALNPETLSTLITSGAIDRDVSLKAWIRRTYKLPEQSGPDVAPAQPQPEGGPLSVAAAAAGGAVPFRRNPMPHELKATTNFALLAEDWQGRLSRLVDEFVVIRGAQLEELEGQIESLVERNDIAGLADLDVTPHGTEVLAGEMFAAYGEAIDQALEEARRQGVDLDRPLEDENLQNLQSRAEATATLLAKALTEVAGREAARLGGMGISGTEAAMGVSAYVLSLSSKYLEDQIGSALSFAQLLGRKAVIAVALQPA